MLISPFAWSHKSSDSFIDLAIDGDTISGRWDIALRDLEFALKLDNDGDGAIDWGELRNQSQKINAYAFSRFQVKSGEQACIPKTGLLQVDRHSDGAYAVINFDLDCAPNINNLSIQYQLLFDLDSSHRGLMKIQQGQSSKFLVFSPDNKVAIIQPGQTDYWTTFSQFLNEGVWHIWMGYDHILFLLCLLLPSLLRKTSAGWVETNNLMATLSQVGKIVTAFTIAHSITLVLAVLQIVNLPSRLVESAIALSVILVAVNNLKPFFSDRAWLIAFAFGLIHGFGFASVLTDLSLTTSNLGVALVAFNLGVESGQLAIIAIFLPLAYLIRAHWFYRRLVFSFGSQVSILVAAIWFVQRAFNFSGFGV
jgi:hypothetical protein